MRLTVLGSGSCELKAQRSSSSYLVEASGSSLVLDLGQGAWRRLLDSGREVKDVDAVLLSHHHLDHLADVLPLLFALNYDPVLSQEGRVLLVGDRGLGEVLAGLAGVFGRWVQPSEPSLTVALLEPGQGMDVAAVHVRTARAAHIDTSLAYRLECGGRSLVYLGDSAYHPSLVDFVACTDLLIAHAVAADGDPGDMHMSPNEAGRLACEGEVGGLLLSHFYRSADPDQAVASAKRRFAGWVRAAHDGLSLELSDAGVSIVGEQD